MVESDGGDAMVVFGTEADAGTGTGAGAGAGEPNSDENNPREGGAAAAGGTCAGTDVGE